MDAPRKSVRMPTKLISLDEASWRLEWSHVSGQAFAELLLTSQPLLRGLFPGKELHNLIDLSRVIRLRAEPENLVVAGDVKWTDVKLNWPELRAALEKRGCKVSWVWHSDITQEIQEKSRQSDPTRRILGDSRPRGASGGPASTVAPPVRRAGPEWFENAVVTGLVPASGKAPPGKRGPKSGKRENTVAAIRKDLADKKAVLSGHGRVHAARRLGLREIPVIRLEHLGVASV
jgi:hypothetical protein